MMFVSSLHFQFALLCPKKTFIEHGGDTTVVRQAGWHSGGGGLRW